MNEPIIRFYGTVKNGVLSFFRPKLYSSLVASLEGKEFELTLREKWQEESTDQHGYYRGGIIKATCMETESFGGWNEQEIHQYFADKFLKFTKNKIIITPDGQEKNTEVTIIESTGDLGKKRMAEFITKVLNHLAELGIYPLTPEEYNAGKYKSYVENKREKSGD